MLDFSFILNYEINGKIIDENKVQGVFYRGNEDIYGR